MTIKTEETEVIEEPPPERPRFPLVVFLSMLLGVLLTVGVIGVFLYYQKSQALQAEVVAARKELKKKNMALDEMKAQIEILSRQMHTLKEYSVARSGQSREKEKKPAAAAHVADAPVQVEKASGDVEKVLEPEVPIPSKNPPKAKRPKPSGESCELVGKSPEEQAATLQRCVELMDGSKETRRTR